MGKPVFATTDTWVDQEVKLQRGQIWDDEDPIVREHPDHFTDDPHAHGLVRHSGTTPPTRTDSAKAAETATAAPGEKRARAGQRG